MTKSLKQTFHAHKKRVIKCLIHTCEMFHLYSDAKKKKKKAAQSGAKQARKSLLKTCNNCQDNSKDGERLNSTCWGKKAREF